MVSFAHQVMVENSDFTPSQVGCLFTFLARQLAKPDNTLFVNRTLFDQVSVFNNGSQNVFYSFTVHRKVRWITWYLNVTAYWISVLSRRSLFKFQFGSNLVFIFLFLSRCLGSMILPSNLVS